MPINPRFIPYIDEITSYFGGIEVVQYLLTQREMEYILLFSGFVVCVKSWDLALDLKEYGYNIQTPYRVFNQNFEFLYEAYSQSGFFGENEQDLSALTFSPNASFLHIKFESTDEPVCGLLWVCNQLSPNQITSKINEWKLKKKSLIVPQVDNEVFIDLENIAQLGYLKIYFTPRPWTTQITLDEIENDPQTTIIRYDLINILTLYPKRSGWYVIAHVIDNETFIVNLESISGSGVRRFRFTDEGAFFIDFTNNNISAPLIYPNIFPTGDSNESWLNAERKIKINAVGNYAGRQMLAKTTATSIINTEDLVFATSVTNINSSMTYTPPAMASIICRTICVINLPE
jgi:hypothetical protein